MTTERFIQGGDSYSSRYLHSDEKFRKERNWNINLPNEREFKSGECIVTDKDDTAYHIDELVTLLNELSCENKQLKQYKQSVNDVLKSWSQKNLTAKQLQVVLAIMEELNVLGDVE